MNGTTDSGELLLWRRRFRQVTLFSLVALGLVSAMNAVRGHWGYVAISLGALALVVLAWGLNRRGLQVMASLLLLATQIACTVLLMWNGQGLNGAALVALPAILVFAAMLAPPRHLLALLLVVVLAVAAVGVGTLAGWRSFYVDAPSIGHMLLVMCFVGISGLGVRALSQDLRHALALLRVEMQQTRDAATQLTHLAQHDALTQLPNRRLAQELLESALAQARRHHSGLALMFIDLDNFKGINDSLGHAAGDDFLRQAATRLRQCVREADTVSRHGGDEFLVMLPGVSETHAVTRVAQHVLEQLSQTYLLKGTRVESSCSVGIAIFPQDGDGFEPLVKAADTAMYHAKQAGRNTFRYFDEAMNRHLAEELNITSGLRQALLEGQFVLHYQPVFDLQRGELTGAEALVRWQHPGRGLVPPLAFIPIAERSGLIIDIGEWVLQEACRQQAAWTAAGLPALVVAVNMSMVQFRRGNVEAVVQAALRAHGTPAHCLELELTESELIRDSESFIETLQALKHMGVMLSIDDFGTGYSNLSYLQRFDVNTLKIDQSFVRNLNASRHDRAIVQAIIQMAKSLDLTTTAEGIEGEAMRDQLRALGCDHGQGYWFSKPLAAPEFEVFAREGLHNRFAAFVPALDDPVI